jgi:hypothetical protein
MAGTTLKSLIRILRTFGASKKTKVEELDSAKSDVKALYAHLGLKEYVRPPDSLGKAAIAKDAAKVAIKSGSYDKAWGLLHEQKGFFAQHAQNYNWNAEATVAIDGAVSEDLANVLRLEKKHDQALVHILYWIATSSNSIKRHRSKLNAYLNRCKFNNVTIEDADRFLGNIKKVA